LRLEPLEDRRLLSVEPVPTPLEPVDPWGGLVYHSSLSAEVSAPGETDRFTVDLDDRQMLSVVVDPEETLWPTIELLDPNDSFIGRITGDAVGKDAVLPRIPTTVAGTYTVVVSGSSDTAGGYTVRLILGAIVETEAHGGPANDTATVAQDLDPAFIPLPQGSAERIAVLGDVGQTLLADPAASDMGDWYRFSLVDGQSAALALAALTPGSITLDLFDGVGNPLATGVTAGNVEQAIGNFRDTTTDGGRDVYRARVTADSAVPYNLMIARDAGFHLEPGNDADPEALEITRTGTAMGAVGGGAEWLPTTAEFVIHLSADGLRGDLLRDLTAENPALYPSFLRLRDEGAFTYNARADYTNTYTLPNHTSMLTCRPVSRPPGQPEPVEHGWTINYYTPSYPTLHENHPDLDYVPSVFDVVHDRGLSTGHFASKSKFALFEVSYNEIHGADDLDPVGGDNGRNKIDVSVIDYDTARLTNTFVARMSADPCNYSFVHLVDLDAIGHSYGWGSPTWNNTVVAVDGMIGQILTLVDAHPLLVGRTALVVTADHGGKDYNHGTASLIENARIPFFVWGPGIPAGADLYALCGQYADPGETIPDYNARRQPIRNGGSGNFALKLLGLDPVPGSTIGAEQPDVVDEYRVAVHAGDLLTIETFTPAAGPLEFVNELDPAMELYDPAGNLVAHADGATLSHTATVSGSYAIRVLAEAGTAGEYSLHVAGHGGDAPALEVTSTEPAAGERLSNDRPTITVDFSHPILLGSLDRFDLTLDGLPALEVETVDGNTATFVLPDGLADGPHDVAIAAGAIFDLQGSPIEPFGGTFFVDRAGPRVIESSVLNGSVLPAGTLTYTARFDERLDAAALDVWDVLLRGSVSGYRYPDALAYEPSTSTLTVQFAQLPPDNYLLSLYSGDGAFQDVSGHDLDGEPNPWATTPSGDGFPGGDFFVMFTTRYVAVAGRHVFYNGSLFDGNQPAADPQDDAAIAVDKRPLLPGQTATSAHYTSYDRGINGVMVDVANLPGVPTAADFAFRVGRQGDPAEWTPAPPPRGVTVRPGMGVGGSDRVTFTWDDHAITNQWLQVRVLPTLNTGLLEEDVFYFGNAVGESGDSAADARVNAVDVLLARNNPRTLLDPAPVDFPYDFNRDGRVNATDMLLARANQTYWLDALPLINALHRKTAAAGETDSGNEAPAKCATCTAPSSAHWLDALLRADADGQAAKKQAWAEAAADEPWAACGLQG